MDSYKTKIIISWLLFIVATITWATMEADHFIWKIFILLAILPRFNNAEKERIEALIQNQGILTKLGFIYMLGWLIYILFVYFKNPGNTEQILSHSQFLLFITPIIVIFVISEIKWFFCCNAANKT